MRIRLKVMLLLASMLLILGLVEVIVEKSILMPSFAELEHDDARTAMRRINNVLTLSSERLALSAADWGNWADTYRFAQDRNAAYLTDNITPTALKQLQVNLVALIAADGRILMARDLDLSTEQGLGLEFVQGAELPLDFPWRRSLRDGQSLHGLLRTNQGILMLAAAPVLDGTGAGPQRGMMMMGRLLLSAEIVRLGEQAQARVTLGAPPPQAFGLERLTETEDTTQVSRSFVDLYGRPLMALTVEVPRRITERGRSAIAYASAYLIGAAVAVLLVLILILNWVVLRPLGLITRHAQALGAGEDLTAQLMLARRDEFGVLAREFDRMVSSLAESRRRLVDQSFHAGFAELAKGVLHNLGNAMTPIGVGLATLEQRLRSMPCEDALAASAELQQPINDAQRGADLHQFLPLACGEMVAAKRAAQQDVEVLIRQTSVVQGVLSEQMRSVRNEHVVEAVRLPDLLAQSLEVVPDNCRQRLIVDADDSLRQVGVVRVARTVLRLILQNLIINAADAIRDAGKSRGVLRVTAQIVPLTRHCELHLQCADDGIGIASADLERIFEQGFSTKSSLTNYGIGLHWCANAIRALGGRIWAASAGPGQGTSMHLVVPLST